MFFPFFFLIPPLYFPFFFTFIFLFYDFDYISIGFLGHDLKNVLILTTIKMMLLVASFFL